MKLTDFPFVSVLKHKKTGELYTAIIQDISKTTISFFNLYTIYKAGDIVKVVNLSNAWWNSQPFIPVSVFYREKFDRYNYARHHYSVNDIEIISGFKGIRLKDISERRIKRKLITIG